MFRSGLGDEGLPAEFVREVGDVRPCWGGRGVERDELVDHLLYAVRVISSRLYTKGVEGV